MKFKIYCINLYEREDRYNFVKNEFKKYNLDVHFIRNFKHKLGGRYGCFKSHIQCLKDAKKNNLDTCLIFEDDIKLTSNCNKIIENCLNFIKKQKNVDIIYAHNVSNLYIEKYYSNNIYYGKSFFTPSIFLTKKSIEKILKKHKKYINKNIHYDAFLYLILQNTFISTDSIIKLMPFGSNNDNWSNNYIIIIFQKLLSITSVHLRLSNFIVITIFKILIKNNNDKLKYLLINFINNKLIKYLTKNM